MLADAILLSALNPHNVGCAKLYCKTMKCFAITGGIGCGKSALGKIFADLGCSVLEADAVVHELEAPDGAATAAIAEMFGGSVLDEKGGICRKTLGKMVFADSSALAKLNAMVHPLVKQRFREWAKQDFSGIGIGVIPLLFEVGWQEFWQGVVCVSCHPEIQWQRLRARGWQDLEIKQRLAAQMPLSLKELRSDWVIHNNGSIEDLKCDARKVLRNMMEKCVS